MTQQKTGFGFEFEFVMSHKPVGQRVFEHLRLIDQLRLARTTRAMRQSFMQHVWPGKYRQLIINVNGENDFAIGNESESNWRHLNAEELKEFMHLHGQDIQDLKDNHRQSAGDEEMLPNLRNLDMGRRDINLLSLKQLTKNFPLLQDLKLYIQTSGPIAVNEMLNISALRDLSNLRSLTLNCDVNVVLSFKDYRAIINCLALEKLIVDPQLSCAEPNENAKDISANFIENLSLKELSLSLGNCQYLPSALQGLHQLMNLSLELPRPAIVNDEILRSIWSSCAKLSTFTLSSALVACKDFTLPSGLTDLSLYACEGLTSQNLASILTSVRLNNFSSIYCNYQGEFLSQSSFLWPSYLHSLKCDNWASEMLCLAFTPSNCLKTLKWHSCLEPRRDIANRLESCSELHTLHWQGSLNTQHLMALHKLQDLTIDLDISQIPQLLCHPSLRHLHVPQLRGNLSMDIGVMELRTNLEVLKMPLKIMKKALNLWLAILNVNQQITMEVAYGPKEMKHQDDFILQLVENPEFPIDLETIHIWGYKINCQELRSCNDSSVLEKLWNNTKHLRSLRASEVHKILFSRREEL